MGTPTMPPKGVIKARARVRLGELRAMMQAAATPSPKAVADAQLTEQQSQKKAWMKDAMNKRVKHKKIAEVAAKYGADDADALDKMLGKVDEEAQKKAWMKYTERDAHRVQFYEERVRER